MQATDLPARAQANRSKTTKLDSYTALSKLSNIPAATLWRQTQGKSSQKDKAASQQYLMQRIGHHVTLSPFINPWQDVGYITVCYVSHKLL